MSANQCVIMLMEVLYCEQPCNECPLSLSLLPSDSELSVYVSMLQSSPMGANQDIELFLNVDNSSKNLM